MTGCGGDCLDLRGKKKQEAGENCRERSFIICTFYRILELSHEEECSGWGM
jgi:hypothetical protein